MYTTKAKKLNEKMADALQMITNANNAIERSRSNIQKYDAADYFSMYKTMYNRRELEARLDKYEAIKTRLVRYYEGLLYKLIIDAFKNGITLDNYTNGIVCY